ncbi:MAG: hypothetical protein RBR35_14920 [Salinivirgaceae bacterium]|nr:hypothetical protein [Salinivirgaceae bacterium]
MKSFLTFIALLMSASLLAQDKSSFFTIKEQHVGIQVNPYKNPEKLMHFESPNGDKFGITGALRYAVENRNHFTIGSEFTFYNQSKEIANVTRLGLGIFTRYTLFAHKKVHPFIELNAYYEYYKTKFDGDLPSSWGVTNSSLFQLNYFVAPGLNFYLYSNKLSMDLMVKITHQETLIDAYKILPTFRINFHW